MKANAVARSGAGSGKTAWRAKPAKVARRAKPTSAHSSAQASHVLDPRLEALAKLFIADRRVSLGKRFASMGLKVDGRLFALVVRGNWVVKLPQARVDELVAQRAGEYFDPGHGRLMKEWISMKVNKPEALSLGREAFAFVSAAE